MRNHEFNRAVRWASLWLAMAGVAVARDSVVVGDAYVRAEAKAGNWTVGNAALELELQAGAGGLKLTGFRNKLGSQPAEYVLPSAAVAPFLAGSQGGLHPEVLWSRALAANETAPLPETEFRVKVKAGDLIGFGVHPEGDANGDETEWATEVRYQGGETYRSIDDRTLDQGPIWYYAVRREGTRFLDYLDTVESLSGGPAYNTAGQIVAGSEKAAEAQAERVRCTATYVPYRVPRASPFASATRLQPSWILGAYRVWRAPKDGEVTLHGRPKPAKGKVKIEILHFHEPAAARADASATWQLAGGKAHQVNAGGRPAAQLDLDLRRGDLRASFHVLIYPGAAVVRHWVAFENTGVSALRLPDEDHFSLTMPAGNYRHSWMYGGNSREVAGLLRDADVTRDYRKSQVGYMTDLYTPWLAMFRTDRSDGWFMSPEYQGQWMFDVNRQASGAVQVSAALPEAAGRELAAGAGVELPVFTMGVFRDSLDDMGRRLHAWQYEYLWDLTNHEWYGRIPTLANWYNDVHNLQENFAGRIADLDMETADFMRATGSDLLWDDAGWSESPNIWTPTREGPDFAETNRHVAKSGMKWLLWFCAVPSKGLMDTKVGSWGDFQWRTDGFSERNLKAIRAFFGQVEDFITEHPRSSFHTCHGGSRYAHTFETQRMADINYFTDSGGGDQANYYFSYLETPDKWTDITPIFATGGTYDFANIRQLLTMVPVWHMTYQPETRGQDREEARRIFEIYRYLTQAGVAGRHSYVAHPAVEGDTAHYYFQRLSLDRQRSVIVIKHKAPAGTKVYPRELLPERDYVVGLQSRTTTAVRRGAELMANGIVLNDAAIGELIYIGLPGRPGGGSDRTPPSAPGRVLSGRETTLGHSGVGLHWSPGTDDGFVSHYEVSRGGKVIGQVSAGTYYFDHSAERDEREAAYAVRTVDGDGNSSAWTPAQRGTDATREYAALGGHFRVAGREGWEALVTKDGKTFQSMTFVPPAKNPGGDFSGNGQQVGGVEGYWEGPGAARNGRGWQQASSEVQAVRRWTAPRAGTVRILGRAVKEHYRRDKGAALPVRITHNLRPVWPASGWAKVPVADDFGLSHDLTANVAAGDTFDFILGLGTDSAADIVAWMPRIVYQDEAGAAAPAPGRTVVRILSGSPVDYVDVRGNTWSADREYSGGQAMAAGKVTGQSLPMQDDPALYERGREGAEFTYRLTVKPGLYSLRLLFAERQHEWSFERPFNLSINGRGMLTNFDVNQAARGPGRSYARLFRYLVPDANGQIVLRFSAGFDPVQKSRLAMVQAIELLPEVTAATRIDIGAEQPHLDWRSDIWAADAGTQGRILTAERVVAQAAPTLNDQRLYQTARSARELVYRIPAAPGLYSVQLKFAELWLGEKGQRPMNIEINGRRFRTDWDPATAAGQLAMAADLRAPDITPDKDGFIVVRIVATGANDAILQGLALE